MNLAEHFGDRLAHAVRQRGTPVLVGLDPRVEQLPEGLLSKLNTADAQAVADAYERFCRGIIDVVAPLVAVVKPQMAFFEQLGPAGMSALAQVVAYAHTRDLLVILDGKRNDIGSTAAAYADAYLGRRPSSPWSGDALTVSPYLGEDSLLPFVHAGRERGAGVFILVKTSNPGSGFLQDLVCGQEPVYLRLARYVEQQAAGTAGQEGYGCIGAVVGATYPEQLSTLRAAMPHAWILVPGYGAQGGTAQDVAAAFASDGFGAIVNSSRGIIFAHERPEYREKFGARRWQEAVEAATRQMMDELRSETAAGKLVGGAE